MEFYLVSIPYLAAFERKRSPCSTFSAASSTCCSTLATASAWVCVASENSFRQLPLQTAVLIECLIMHLQNHTVGFTKHTTQFIEKFEDHSQRTWCFERVVTWTLWESSANKSCRSSTSCCRLAYVSSWARSRSTSISSAINWSVDVWHWTCCSAAFLMVVTGFVNIARDSFVDHWFSSVPEYLAKFHLRSTWKSSNRIWFSFSAIF